MKNQLLKAIQAASPAAHAKIDPATISDDELVALHESVCGTAAAPAGTQRLVESAVDAPLTRADLAMFNLRNQSVTKINASKLPVPAKERLAADFGARERFTEAEVDQAIKAEGDYLARFTESGTVRVPMFGGGSIEVGDRSVQVKDMLDAFFDPTHKDHRNVQSFRECYIEITGDRRVTGRLADVDMSRLSESLGAFRESVTSSTFSAALGDSITRRMQALYLGMTELEAWKRVATWGPVNDFRSQQRMRIGGYGNLPGVAQGGAYLPLTSPTDEKAEYAVKRYVLVRDLGPTPPLVATKRAAREGGNA